MAHKYGIVLKESLTAREASLFDVVAPGRNGYQNEKGQMVYNGRYDHYVSVEALNWDSRHDKVVNDAREAFNAVKEPITEPLITTRGKRALLKII